MIANTFGGQIVNVAAQGPAGAPQDVDLPDYATAELMKYRLDLDLLESKFSGYREDVRRAYTNDALAFEATAPPPIDPRSAEELLACFRDPSLHERVRVG